MLSFLLKQVSESTNYEQSETIRVSEFKMVLNFDHGSGNCKKLSTVPRHKLRSKIVHFTSFKQYVCL